MLKGYVVDCFNCGYLSDEIEDFVKMSDGALCQVCYDDIVKDSDTMLREDEARKAEALAYSINADYFD